MRTAFIIIYCSCLFFGVAAAQSGQTAKDWYFKLSGGSVAFGTGVFEDGYGIGIDVSKNLVKIPKPGMGKLLVGGELLFEQGANSPKTGFITDEDFPQTSFSQVSASTLWPKVSYHPFHKTLIGFNIQVGPTVGYTYSSWEGSAEYITIPGGYYRSGTVTYDHGFRVGYRISSGYEFAIGKQWMAGARVDFSNTNKGEINTLVGLKTGVRF
jgi:hypothetical protein